MPLKLAARISAVSGTLVKISAGVGSLVAGYSLGFMGAELMLVTLAVLTLFMLSGSFVCEKEYGKYHEQKALFIRVIGKIQVSVGKQNKQ
ncbi:MAG: hypothetical protein ACR5LF_03495 [Symbiopectobacterium sp.]